MATPGAGAEAGPDACGPGRAGWPCALELEGEFVLHLGGAGDARLRFSESRDAVALDLVIVPSSARGQGHGTALIARLLALADAQHKPVLLNARPVGRSSAEALERLVRYYEGLGFRPEGRGVTSVAMRRPPPASAARDAARERS